MDAYDWELTKSIPWKTQRVTVVGDLATITYTQTQTFMRGVEHADTTGRDTSVGRTGPDDWPTWVVEETEDRIVTQHGQHRRESIDDVPQTDAEWHSMMKDDITVSLSDLNKVEEAEVDITNRVLTA